ncbi:DUF5677 domain-containing protein [Hydrogenophaga sp. R2]|uniref:DUF5677 domain-containing protein n=1 Tax=Hydrogenophaga sp. R2 TaxID=3132827 RepID=UPI003CF479F9
MDYRQADDQVFAIVEKYGAAVFGAGCNTEFPRTLRAMAMFCAKANSLKTAMFDSVDNNNPYAYRVLYRSFCEHFLRFLYLWVRMSKEKTDAVGSEYYNFCGAIEALDYCNSLRAAESLVGNEIAIDFSKAIETLYPEAARLNKRQLEEYSGRFKYRSILRYLSGDGIGFVSRDVPFLSAILPAYALYSSFVHGGPYTDLEMFEYVKPETIEKCESDLEVVVMMNATVFMLTSMAVTFAKGEKVDHIGAQVNQVLRKFAAA